MSLKDGEAAHAVVMYGVLGGISKPIAGTQLRYLLHPDGRKLPLFEIARQIEIDNSGFLCEPEEEIESDEDDSSTPTPTAPPPSRAVSVVQEEVDVNAESEVADVNAELDEEPDSESSEDPSDQNIGD